MDTLLNVSDADLRAEVERRHLLVDAAANDSYEGYYATDPDRRYSGFGRFEVGPFVWRTDVIWTVGECMVCTMPADGMAYQARAGNRYFCDAHMPVLSDEWTALFHDRNDERYWR